MQEGKGETAEEVKDAPTIAKLQAIGEIEYNKIYDKAEFEKLEKLVKEAEEENPDCTIKYRSIEYGFYDDPKLGLKEFQAQLQTIANEMKYALDTFPKKKD
jgi:anaerobic ribonucleoside-triphosphate reductase